MQKVTLVIVALLGLTQGRFASGKCDTPKLQENFDAVKYMGVWYEQYRDSNTAFEPNADCVKAEYTL
jgi:lipocalin